MGNVLQPRVWILLFVGLGLTALVACENAGPRQLVAPQTPQLEIGDDSNPATCAAWQCRPQTATERQEMEADLYYAINEYQRTGREECALNARAALGTLAMGNVYLSQTTLYVPNSNPRAIRVGQADRPTTSMYIDVANLRRLGSMNDVVLTVIHEQFHLNDSRIGTAGYYHEPPAISFEQSCAF